MSPPAVTVIVLAGRRAGVPNPLAERAGVSHKCFAPLRGRPLLDYVLDTVTKFPSAGEIRVSLEPAGHLQVERLAARFADRGIPIVPVASERGLAGSVYAAAGADEGPFVITTADNVLLTPEAIEQVSAALAHHDGVFVLAARANVLAAHPDGQRNFYRFRDGEYANCNIYALANRRVLEAGAELFRGGGQFMKSVWRMIGAFGLVNILLLRLGVFDRAGAMRRLSGRLGIDVAAIEFADGALAIDVDNERTYRVCEEILTMRERG